MLLLRGIHCSMDKINKHHSLMRIVIGIRSVRMSRINRGIEISRRRIVTDLIRLNSNAFILQRRRFYLYHRLSLTAIISIRISVIRRWCYTIIVVKLVRLVVIHIELVAVSRRVLLLLLLFEISQVFR